MSWLAHILAVLLTWSLLFLKTLTQLFYFRLDIVAAVKATDVYEWSCLQPGWLFSESPRQAEYFDRQHHWVRPECPA